MTFSVGDIVDGHIICLKALVGSHNYNLNTEASDKDYKYFVYPTFDDLYDKKMYHKTYVSDIEDYTVHDIRMLPSLLWKANLNFIEILYSQELNALDGLDEYLTEHSAWLATMNMPRLYDAARGMSLQKQKLMLKDSPGRHESIEKFGYDTKSACHALRILDFLERLTDKCSVREALWYSDRDYMRHILLSVKAGDYTLQGFKDTLKAKEAKMDLRKTWFYCRKQDIYNFNMDARNDLSEFIKDKIKLRIKAGIVR